MHTSILRKKHRIVENLRKGVRSSGLTLKYSSCVMV